MGTKETFSVISYVLNGVKQYIYLGEFLFSY